MTITRNWYTVKKGDGLFYSTFSLSADINNMLGDLAQSFSGRAFIKCTYGNIYIDVYRDGNDATINIITKLNEGEENIVLTYSVNLNTGQSTGDTSVIIGVPIGEEISLGATGSTGTTMLTFISSHEDMVQIIVNNRRFYNLFYKLFSKLDLYNSYIRSLTEPFIKKYVQNGHVTRASSSFSINGTPSCAIYGNLVYIGLRMDKTANWDTGDITNTSICTFKIAKIRNNTDLAIDLLISGMYYQNVINGSSGGLKKIRAMASDTTADDFVTCTVNVEAVDTADKYSQCWATCFLHYNSLFGEE